MVTDADASCRERVAAAIAAAEELQRRCNAFTVIRAEEALAEAEELDRRRSQAAPGPLYGMPVVVKDLFDVAGLPTTGGCAAYRDRIATADADVVRALRAAGAVIVAKTNQHELGAGATGLVSAFGPVTNPIDPARIAGGSSSGSAAAVAAGVVPIAIGSDTGGSIRIPASLCGITGLRPTPGRISLVGAQPMSPGYDTAGPMARTARECAAAFAVLVQSGHDAGSVDLDGLRIGLPEPFFELVHPEVRDAVERAAEACAGLGAVVERLPGPAIAPRFAGFRHVWADLAHHHRDVWDSEEVSESTAWYIDYGRRMSGLDYAASRAAAEETRRSFAEVLGQVDVLLTPATPYAAPLVDQQEVPVAGGVVDVHRGGLSRLAVPVNEAGLPAVAFPVGTTSDNLPIGAQLIGPPYADERLLAIVARYQEA